MARAVSQKSRPAWAALPDRKLMELRLKDIRIPLDGTWVADCLADLNQELQDRNITVRAHGWISDEWFSPQNTPGIAIPFYLTHPRLMRLERRMMLEIEGGTRRECMRILRHEAGHIVQQAFAVHRRRRWQELFGRASRPYPDHYRPNPTSKNYVQHLRRWYAQCHPDEDFAETFAVWLTSRSAWRVRYAGWPALKKLEYVDQLMSELAGERPISRPRVQVDPISQMSITLGEHYVRKRERFAVDTPTVFDRDLLRVFSDEARHAGAPTAASILRRNRAQIIRSVARWTGEYPVALDAALDDMIERCRALKLRAPRAERQVRLELAAMLSSKAVYTLYSSSRRQWFAV